MAKVTKGKLTGIRGTVLKATTYLSGKRIGLWTSKCGELQIDSKRRIQVSASTAEKLQDHLGSQVTITQDEDEITIEIE